MTANSAWLRKIVVGMLAMIEPAAWRIKGSDDIFNVALGGTRIAFSTSGPVGASLERLASAIEGRIAFKRARAMLAAARVEDRPLPLWLVTGSSVLAAWLAWSRSDTVFRRRLALSDDPGLAPVFGTMDRPMRRSLGQAAAKIRVRSGLAIAERIELPGRLRCTASFAREARIRIEGGPLPETIVMALADGPGRNDRRLAADIVDHPFIVAADLKLAAIRNDGDAVVMEVESSWGPLAPVPEAAWTAAPRDADPTCPWHATAREVTVLYLQGEFHGRPPFLRYAIVALFWYPWHLTFLQGHTIGTELSIFALILAASLGIGFVADRTHSILAAASVHIAGNIMGLTA